MTKEELKSFLSQNKIAPADLADFFEVSLRTVQKWLSDKPGKDKDEPQQIPAYVGIVLRGESLADFMKKKRMEEWRRHSAQNREHVRRALRGLERDQLF
jgi:hypothetical protein